MPDNEIRQEETNRIEGLSHGVSADRIFQARGTLNTEGMRLKRAWHFQRILGE